MKTIKKIRPAIARTRTTSMMVKPFLELILCFVIVFLSLEKVMLNIMIAAFAGLARANCGV